ncbi:hypothetical protein PanWU01x14_324190 [Parasponia andersonii]|uniref:Uncharacterized protein n=1 Tax=Parasponia andersonii TaxID=3476 RepID=A0A2P5AKH5_PARAD|nr:hypothetical protein PanWU01x14_324190 [Parasponia andersonii]
MAISRAAAVETGWRLRALNRRGRGGTRIGVSGCLVAGGETVGSGTRVTV